MKNALASYIRHFIKSKSKIAKSVPDDSKALQELELTLLYLPKSAEKLTLSEVLQVGKAIHSLFVEQWIVSSSDADRAIALEWQEKLDALRNLSFFVESLAVTQEAMLES